MRARLGVIAWGLHPSGSENPFSFQVPAEFKYWEFSTVDTKPHSKKINHFRIANVGRRRLETKKRIKN